MSIAVITFPGSNCDRDCLHVLRNVVGSPAESVFHKETSLDRFTGVLIPGGFSYGDYLRAGALAKISPIMPAIRRFAENGGPVLGICNGFQILCEAGLLPGALMLNKNLRFISRWIEIKVENCESTFTKAYWSNQILRMPIAHAEGNFTAESSIIDRLFSNRQVVFTYYGPQRPDSADGNPNGSLGAIAGIVNESGNVLGMMPHPDRSSEAILGSADGLPLLRSFAEASINSSLIRL